MTETLYIGGILQNGSVTDYRLSFQSRDSPELTYVQSVSVNGNTVASDELYVTLRCRADSISVNADLLAGYPDLVVSGYAEFHTANDATFLTANGETFMVPETQDLADFWLSLFDGVSRNTPVWYHVADENGHERLEKYYWKSMLRTAKYDFEVTAQSPIGLLSSDFRGGMYAGETLADVIGEILQTPTTGGGGNSTTANGGETSTTEGEVVENIVPYSIDSDIQNIRVYGWMPYQSRRECIHLLALAYGFIIRRDENRDLFFTLPPSEPYELPDTVIFNGGSVDYRTGATYSRVDVTQYQFLKPGNDKEVTLFDNSDGTNPADYTTVPFDDAPVYDVTAPDGLTLHWWNCNCAVVSGAGTLTGKAYTQIASIASIDGDPDADAENILTIEDAPLITDLNAENVAQKLLDSMNAPTVEMDFLRGTETPGDTLSFVDPFGTSRTGVLTSMDGKVTSLDRVTASFLCGYEHQYWGNTYDSVIALTGSGTWNVPDILGGQSVRVVLISGGQGGSSGQHGSDDNATGGSKGSPGSGGRVKVVKLPVAAGTSFVYRCGAGGAGGTPSDNTTDSPSDSMTVYVTPTGNRWHLNPTCNGGSYTPTTYLKAVQKGLSPCENCASGDRTYYVSNLGEDGEPTTFGDYSSADGNIIATGYADIIHGTRYALTGPDYGFDGGQATTAEEATTTSGQSPTFGSGGRYYAKVQRKSIVIGEDSGYETPGTWIGGTPGKCVTRNITDDTGDSTESYTNYVYGGLGGGAAVGNDGGQGRDGSIHTQAPYNALGGTGGKGGDAIANFPPHSSDYGYGGSGGHGGGEGGQGGSYYNHNSDRQNGKGKNGAGGSGSDGQSGADGCILIYFRKPSWKFFINAKGHLILRYDARTPPPFSRNNANHLLYTYTTAPPGLVIDDDGHLYMKE